MENKGKKLITIILISILVLFSGCDNNTTYKETQGGQMFDTYYTDGYDAWENACIMKIGSEKITDFTIKCVGSLQVEEQAYVVAECSRRAMDMLCPKMVSFYDN